jgi:hypothetical protein
MTKDQGYRWSFVIGLSSLYLIRGKEELAATVPGSGEFGGRRKGRTKGERQSLLPSKLCGAWAKLLLLNTCA